MKEFILKAGRDGFPYGLGMVEGAVPPQAAAVVQLYLLEGYRPVTPEEKDKYSKPHCAKYWSVLERRFEDADSGNYWEHDSDYFVPVGFKFKREDISNEIIAVMKDIEIKQQEIRKLLEETK